MAKPGKARPASASVSPSRSSSRSRSYSGSDSRSRSRSFSSSASPSRSVSSRSRSPPPQRKGPNAAAKRGRSQTPPSKKASPPRNTSPVPESVVLHIDHLSRNVNEAHLKEIFGNFGEIVNVELAIDRLVNLPRGYGYVEFKKRVDAEKALLHMDGGQIDGCVIRVRFTLTQRQKASSPPKAIPAAPKREAPPRDKVGIVAEKDAPQRPREASPRRKPPSPPPPRRRSPPPNRRIDSSRRRPDGSPRRRVESPVRRRADSPPHRRGETPPRRRAPSPPRRRSPSPPRRNRSPARISPRRGRGSPIRKRSPIPPRRRSPPRRPRSPPRRSPPSRRRSRSPIRRPIRSHSRSVSPRRSTNLDCQNHSYSWLGARGQRSSECKVNDRETLRVCMQSVPKGAERHRQGEEVLIHLTLDLLVLARELEEYPEVVVLEGLLEEEAAATVGAAALPALKETNHVFRVRQCRVNSEHLCKLLKNDG
ncbi:serine/arginine-rich splicing factor SR45-like isoform X4 [Canna indica]|uniref:Serine/arginine-rich splicing factor SR45-like isoform X4 n=1 Tax=Canna indica TaxID=4628 RepID=A0AAQ3KTA1_9LILI|nr:serine/arginine-rich splicing factor SR45-like isoform X4 [Canna indica]